MFRKRFQRSRTKNRKVSNLWMNDFFSDNCHSDTDAARRVSSLNDAYNSIESATKPRCNLELSNRIDSQRRKCQFNAAADNALSKRPSIIAHHRIKFLVARTTKLFLMHLCSINVQRSELACPANLCGFWIKWAVHLHYRQHVTSLSLRSSHWSIQRN